MTFGERLRELMEERNLTQRQLGKELNIAASTLNGYVNDNREPDFQTLLCFARYFQVSTDYLLGFSSAQNTAQLPGAELTQRLLHYYKQLSPDFRILLVNEAKLLVKHCQDAAAPAPRKQ